MADAITIKALQDASLDAKSLEEVVNGDENVIVTTRLGETYPSIKSVLEDTISKFGFITHEAERAEYAAERAETFLEGVEQTLGLYAADIYKDVATGLAATEDTDNFWVIPNEGGDIENLTLFNNNASVAVKLYELYNLELYMIEEGSIKPSLIGE